MDCLVGFIGLSSSIGVAESGLYLNTLPNINILSVNKIADSDQISSDRESDYIKVMKDIEERAIKRLRTMFIIELNRCYRMSKRDKAECLICENKELLAETLRFYMASELMTERMTSDRINRYTTIDKITAQHSRIEFDESAERELHVAVMGIDIESSDCFVDDEVPDHTGIITVVEYTP